VPILGHYAKTDSFVSTTRVEELHARAARQGAQFEVHFYDAGHAFMRPGPDYVEAAAALAWDRTLAFLSRELGPVGSS
jgi:carboxymethylenebutenolidase